MRVTGNANLACHGQESAAAHRPQRAIEPEDLFRFRFVTAADLSPDGGSIVFALTRTDVEANTDHTDLMLLDVATGEQRQLTHVDALNTYPAFSPDGRQVAFRNVRLHLTRCSGGTCQRRFSSTHDAHQSPVRRYRPSPATTNSSRCPIATTPSCRKAPQIGLLPLAGNGSLRPRIRGP